MGNKIDILRFTVRPSLLPLSPFSFSLCTWTHKRYFYASLMRHLSTNPRTFAYSCRAIKSFLHEEFWISPVGFFLFWYVPILPFLGERTNRRFPSQVIDLYRVGEENHTREISLFVYACRRNGSNKERSRKINPLQGSSTGTHRVEYSHGSITLKRA